MAAYDMLIGLVKTYFKELNYKEEFIDDFFSSKNFSEILAIKLANSNVVIKNKTYPSSKQTHIAITGEAIDYFYGPNDLTTKDNDVVDKKSVVVSAANISQLNGLSYELLSTNEIELIFGSMTIGTRTQKQVQLSKRNSGNSDSFNLLRMGLYENDLLILMKRRGTEESFAIGITKKFYSQFIKDYDTAYETLTYLRIPKR